MNLPSMVRIPWLFPECVAKRDVRVGAAQRILALLAFT
jgi:hypothetical protein